jgi:hypothetical protein
VPRTLRDLLAIQNRRCDQCLHAEVPHVPTLFIFRQEIDGLIKVRRLMLNPGAHAYCPILRERVKADGGCDEFKRSL